MATIAKANPADRLMNLLFPFISSSPRACAFRSLALATSDWQILSSGDLQSQRRRAGDGWRESACREREQVETASASNAVVCVYWPRGETITLRGDTRARGHRQKQPLRGRDDDAGICVPVHGKGLREPDSAVAKVQDMVQICGGRRHFLQSISSCIGTCV